MEYTYKVIYINSDNEEEYWDTPEEAFVSAVNFFDAKTEEDRNSLNKLIKSYNYDFKLNSRPSFGVKDKVIITREERTYVYVISGITESGCYIILGVYFNRNRAEEEIAKLKAQQKYYNLDLQRAFIDDDERKEIYDRFR